MTFEKIDIKQVKNLQEELSLMSNKKIITDIVKVDGYITTFKSNGILKTVQRDIYGIVEGII